MQINITIHHNVIFRTFSVFKEQKDLIEKLCLLFVRYFLNKTQLFIGTYVEEWGACGGDSHSIFISLLPPWSVQCRMFLCSIHSFCYNLNNVYMKFSYACEAHQIIKSAIHCGGSISWTCLKAVVGCRRNFDTLQNAITALVFRYHDIFWHTAECHHCTSV